MGPELVAEPDSYSVNEDGTLTESATNGLLENDFDLSGAFEADSFSNPAQITYTDSDGTVTASATVTIQVGDNPPVANADFYHTGVGATLTLNAAQGLLKNDFDPDNDPIEATNFSNPLWRAAAAGSEPVALVVDFRRRHVVHHREKLVGDRHGRAGLVAIDEEDEAAGIAVDPRERRLVAVWQAGRGQRVHGVDAPQELPLLRGQLDPFAVACLDGVLGHRNIDALAALGRRGDLGQGRQSASQRQRTYAQHEDLL
jgi:hypothetical protein